MAGAPQHFFLDAGGRGRRYAIHHAPASARPHGLVVYLHPFAEEMNKSRRMAALGSRALASAGFAVLQVDLLGCGDSSGDFSDAGWQDWVDDAVAAADWLRGRYDAPLWLWGHRAGALVAADALRAVGLVQGLLLWQPAVSGRPVLQQFLRLRAAAEMASGQKGVVERLRADLASGRVVEVAGYSLSPALAGPLEAASMARAEPPPRVVWLEVGGSATSALLPASRDTVQAWTSRGAEVSTTTAVGPAFWQTTEIEDAPALIEATVAAMAKEVPA